MKVIDIIQKTEKECLCVLYAEKKSDVTKEVKGLPKKCTLAPGSIVYTSSFEVGILKENKTWGWK